MSKTKRLMKELQEPPKNWVQCPVCLGYINQHSWWPKRLTVTFKEERLPICAWCSSRGGKITWQFIKYAMLAAQRPCEDQDKDDCKCPTCTARKLIEYRETKIGKQAAPITSR